MPIKKHGGGGASVLTGDAVVANVVAGKTFYKDDPTTKLTGTLALTGDAVVANVLADKTFYADNPASKLTGTMTNNGAVNTDISAKATEVTIAAGYHNGSGKVKIATAEQDKCIAENIKSGVTLLGVAGSLAAGVDTSDATATASGIETGTTAYVNGAKLTGLRKHIVVATATYFYVLDSLGLNRMGGGSNYGYDLRNMALVGDKIFVAPNKTKMGAVLKYGLALDMETANIYNSTFYNIVSDGTNIFGAGDAYIEKLAIASFSGGNTANYLTYGGAIYGMDILGSYLYLGGATVKKVFKAALSNCAKQTESADYGGTIYSVCCDSTNIFAGGATTQKVFKYDTDLAKLAESADYGGTIRVIHQDGDHLYVGGETTNKVYKLLKSDLSKVTESASYGGAIYTIKSDSTYLYIGGVTTRKVYKLLKSDLSKVEESAAFSATIENICFI